MNLPRYEVRASTDRLNYMFVSEGPKGRILKVISYSYLEDLEVWNLGFGDYNILTDEIDDQIVSNNGDGRKILTTVAFTLNEFFATQPSAVVFFTGSTSRRTKVYGRAISSYWKDISDQFLVEGVNSYGVSEPFQQDKLYAGFQIRQR
ncbi:hypothetical protein EXU85_23790 [Spirosoma sp. KCTC 42546]|uniref:DUF6934 family protein n=1 Tax=Spirosoma sp. KCTC 42546 TaxID=2520506 RepID=UPI0011570B0F|nr:hypothetical protein [Spirosoma sp. KCTC 42546]QDK81467.1 hypothetical protein EXU85_23790 [Spirosoma sp. KCTC 42546]